MERTLIAWNLPNWVTVLLMAAAGYAVLALVTQFIIRKPMQQQSAAAGY